jgi:hypothetical protein
LRLCPIGRVPLTQDQNSAPQRADREYAPLLDRRPINNPVGYVLVCFGVEDLRNGRPIPASEHEAAVQAKERTLMAIYAIPAVLTLLALVVQVRRNRHLDLAVLALCTCAVVLVSGLRWYSDVDYPLYVEMYTDNPLLRDFSRESIGGLYGEPGYLFLTAMFKSLGLGFPTLALSCAAVSLALKARVAATFSRHASLALCLYLCIHFVTIEFIQMRWAVATGFLALGFALQYSGDRKAAALSHATSLVFHYFSVVFWAVAIAVGMKGYRRFFVLFAASLAGAVFLKIDFLGRFLISDTNLYVLQRLTRYASDPESHVGIVSYLKLLMYPAVYLACVRVRPSFPWRTDPLNVFLLKVSLTTLSVTLLVSFLPIFHFRATVLADFFAILWILNALYEAVAPGLRTTAFAGLACLYGVWYAIDVSNYINAGRLYEYHTWILTVR